MTFKSPSSLSEFLKIIEEKKSDEVKSGNDADFIFRGQNVDKPLIPRIARLKPKGKLVRIEKLMMAEFERQIPPFTEHEPHDAWDLIALAQHHGLPTRLLDWTFSALAGLWFCVGSPPVHSKDNGKPLDGVVWVLKSASEDFLNFPTKETPYTSGRTRVFRPRIVTQRILSQNGLFTCHKRTSEGKFVSLETNKAYKDRLIKIHIMGKNFEHLRDQLIANGVSNLALFPDLDGLTAHLKLRYFHNSM